MDESACKVLAKTMNDETDPTARAVLYAKYRDKCGGAWQREPAPTLGDLRNGRK